MVHWLLEKLALLVHGFLLNIRRWRSLAQLLHGTDPAWMSASCLGVIGEQCRLTQDTDMTVLRRYMSTAGRILL